jgi:hypothetical protein
MTSSHAYACNIAYKINDDLLFYMAYNISAIRKVGVQAAFLSTDVEN